MLVLENVVIYPRRHNCLRSVHQSIHVYPCQSAPHKVNSTTFSTTFNHTAFSRKDLVYLFASLTWLQKQERPELASANFRFQEREHSRSRSAQFCPHGGARQRQAAARATTAHEALSPGDPDVTAARPTSTTSLAGDFRSYVGELFLSNKLSGLDTRELASRATSAGARSVERTAQTGASGRCPGNISRDLMRNLMRNCKMPSLYFGDIPVWDFKRGQAMTCDVPFLLVREVLTALASKSSDFVEQCSSLPYLPALDEEIAVFLSSRWRWP